MKCSTCGYELKDDWNFCPDCKKQIKEIDMKLFDELNIEPIDGFCSKCAYELDNKWLYCPRCSTMKSFEKKEIKKEVKKEKPTKIDIPFAILFFLDILYSAFSVYFYFKIENVIAVVFFIFRPFFVFNLLKIAYYATYPIIIKLFSFVFYLIPVLYNYYMAFIYEYEGTWAGLSALGDGIGFVFNTIFAIIAFILICLTKEMKRDSDE